MDFHWTNSGSGPGDAGDGCGAGGAITIDDFKHYNIMHYVPWRR